MKYGKPFIGGDMDYDLLLGLEQPERYVQKDTRDIKRCMRLEMSLQATRVFVVVKSYDDCENRLIFLPSYTSQPITREVYDSIRDGFVVYANSYFDLGTIPVSYRIISDTSGWEVDVPLPVPVIRRYLDDERKKLLDIWKSGFSKEEYYFETVQSLELC
jgi:hypothetical protein